MLYILFRYLLWPLFMIISGIEDSRNGECFSDKIIPTLNDTMRTGCDSPSNIIDKRLCDGDFLLVISGQIPFIHKRKGASFCVENHVIGGLAHGVYLLS